MTERKTLKERQDALVSDFLKLSSWEDRYKKIIEIGKAMPELGSELKVPEALVKGCSSQVWLHASLESDGTVKLVGDSDALIVKGLVGVILKIYSGATPMEILSTPPEFLTAIGFAENLSPNRANGLNAMLKQIKNFALAFQYLQNSKK